MELREPLERLVTRPAPAAGLHFPPPEAIRIYDTTLRDGEQTPGVAFSPEQKFTIARLLSEMGVHILDVGFPAAAPSEQAALERIVQGRRRGELRQDLEILVMCRAARPDIALTAATLERIGVDPAEVTFFVFTSGSDLHIKYKLGRTLLRREGIPESEWLATPVEFYREANIRLLVDAIQAAREAGARVIEFGGEDGSRADLDYYVRLLAAGFAAGATRIGFPDTVGILTPEGVDACVGRLVREFPGVPIVIHFHNDFGLAAVNTVRAMAGGVTTVAVTANGLGERAGNAALHQVVLILRDLYGVVLPGFRYDLLPRLRDLVERCSGIPVSPLEPVIGERVFTHESGIHAAGVLVEPHVYQAIDPPSVGRVTELRFGKHSGTAAVRHALEAHRQALAAAGIAVDEALVRAVTAELKERRESQCAEGLGEATVSACRQALQRLGWSEAELVEHVLQTRGKERSR